MKKGVLALALGTFGLGIAEFSTMAILPYIAQDIHIDIPMAGTFVSAYLLGVGLGAVLLAFAGRFCLKNILLVLTGLIIIGNICSSMASSYLSVLLFRFIAGLPHGAFFGTSAIVAAKLAGEGKGNRAVAIVMAGMMMANLLGVPLATALGTVISWRLVYVVVGCWELFVLLAIWRYVPALENTQTVSISKQLTELKSVKVWLLLLIIFLGNAAIFGWYSYITPLLTKVAGFSTSILPYLMSLAGIGMVAGNFISGKLSDKFGSARVVTTTQGMICLVLICIFFFSSCSWLCLGLTIVGIGCFAALTSPEQVLYLHLLRGRELLGMTMAQIGFTVGGAIGTSCSGLILEAGQDYHYPALIGAVFAFMGCLASLVFCKNN